MQYYLPLNLFADDYIREQQSNAKGDDEKVNIVRILFECHVLLKCDCPVSSLLRVIEPQNNTEVAKERTTERMSEFLEFRVLIN
jgi:hypothetical protein